MLRELLRLLEKNQGELNIFELSQQLGASPAAILGMIETLIGMGRINELGSECGVCDSCALHNQCTLPVKRARRYKLAR
jgi:hypothetical protein